MKNKFENLVSAKKKKKKDTWYFLPFKFKKPSTENQRYPFLDCQLTFTEYVFLFFLFCLLKIECWVFYPWANFPIRWNFILIFAWEIHVIVLRGAIYQYECESYSSQIFFFRKREKTKVENPYAKTPLKIIAIQMLNILIFYCTCDKFPKSRVVVYA